jgi:hypothetical protein
MMRSSVLQVLLLHTLTTPAAALTPPQKPLLALRGGAVVYNPARRRTYESVGSWGQQQQHPISGSTRGGDEAVEDPEMSDAERVYVLQQFERPAVRLAFLRKVYTIVAFQMATTAAIVAFLRTNPALMIGLARRLGPGLTLLPLVPLLMLSFMPRERTSGSRLAWFLLAAFTVFEALGVSAVTFAYPLALVLRAAAATAATSPSSAASSPPQWSASSCSACCSTGWEGICCTRSTRRSACCSSAATWSSTRR